MTAGARKLAFLVAMASACATVPASAIDWGSAGKASPGSGTITPKTTLPAPEPSAPKAAETGFDCDTVTRMSWERPQAERENQPGPQQVRRCSRDGFSLEVTPPSQ
ncbi:hypothetical protein [Rhizobium sp. SSA_523]|uniref:hypothetical protein n=1 Tax=Rhizobium sp. SSA_523 TaxID=2952477 RepID=UPI002090FA76|nr:hypothetical protein [Rhizobium sp. SSA_523]MCO5730482.1 hypothetical protein [Rhizobium sp. SSA_523]WKC25521.1 hypothetical protein QTJ18_16305 [Rhizobium sp. SSA_523]